MQSLNKRLLEQIGDGLLKNCRCFLEEKVKITSSNKDFRTNNHVVATYEQMKKIFSFLTKKNCREWLISYSTS